MHKIRNYGINMKIFSYTIYIFTTLIFILLQGLSKNTLYFLQEFLYEFDPKCMRLTKVDYGTNVIPTPKHHHIVFFLNLG